MISEDLVFKAIAHPARRGILALLAKGDCSVKQLTAEFAMSQPAISQHLKELREAELVCSDRVGLEQRYRLTPRPLRYVVAWSERYRTLIDPAAHAWSFMPAPAAEKTGKEREKPEDGR
jgi:DNA-binding transcriptional ArsR family regulator